MTVPKFIFVKLLHSSYVRQLILKKTDKRQDLICLVLGMRVADNVVIVPYYFASAVRKLFS